MASMKARLIAPLSAVLLVLAVPALAQASTTVGQSLPPGAQAAADCAANSGHVTRKAAGTNPYIATVSGVITEWQFQAAANPGSLALQVLDGDPNMNTSFTPVAESSTETASASQLNEFATRIPITAGQFVGLRVVTASHGCYYFVTPGTGFTDFSVSPAPLPGGGPAMFGNAMGDAATNVSATIEPDADNDGYGDETQDGCPGKSTRQDDCVKPTVTIEKTPPKKTKKAKAKFVFSSDDPTATFTCRTDKKEFRPCDSPYKLKKLKQGKHVFVVEALDADDNVSKSASYKWKVKKKK
jgi:hypothetical protein